MISFKQGVKVFGTRPEINTAIIVAHTAYQELGHDLVVTSANDGRHSRASLHYSGLAIDIRTRHLQDGEDETLADKIRSLLTSEYDVVLESDHIHIEFQPKKD